MTLIIQAVALGVLGLLYPFLDNKLFSYNLHRKTSSNGYKSENRRSLTIYENIAEEVKKRSIDEEVLDDQILNNITKKKSLSENIRNELSKANSEEYKDLENIEEKDDLFYESYSIESINFMKDFTKLLKQKVNL